jgi:hypothetical protein
LLCEAFVDIWGILNVQTSGLNEGLVFHFLEYGKVVRGCGSRRCVDGGGNSGGGVKSVVNGVKDNSS